MPAARSEGAAPATGETVERPDPGLARGHWEAPASVFYVVGCLALVGLLVAAAWMATLLRRSRRNARRSRPAP